MLYTNYFPDMYIYNWASDKKISVSAVSVGKTNWVVDVIIQLVVVLFDKNNINYVIIIFFNYDAE